MKNILLAIEFENQTKILIRKASEFAQKFNAKLWLIHVASPDPDFVGYEVGPLYVRESRAHDLREEHKAIQAFAENLNEKGIKSEGLLVQGSTIETILFEAKKLKADLIVMGHHPHGLFYETFIGSKTNELINESKIPVMVIPID